MTVRPVGGERGIALLDALMALALLGIGAAAVTGMFFAVSRGARTAALEGRRAVLMLQLAGRVRTGLVTGDSGMLSMEAGGETFEVGFIRRDSVAPGALELSVAPVRGGKKLVFGAARAVP